MCSLPHKLCRGGVSHLRNNEETNFEMQNCFVPCNCPTKEGCFRKDPSTRIAKVRTTKNYKCEIDWLLTDGNDKEKQNCAALHGAMQAAARFQLRQVVRDPVRCTGRTAAFYTKRWSSRVGGDGQWAQSLQISRVENNKLDRHAILCR